LLLCWSQAERAKMVSISPNISFFNGCMLLRCKNSVIGVLFIPVSSLINIVCRLRCTFAGESVMRKILIQ
jgi:hypothetical protein